jgi:hypothetical protein
MLLVVCREVWSAAVAARRGVAMLAGAHRILGLVTCHRAATEPAGTIGSLPSMRRRRGWAHSIDRLLQLASRTGPFWHYPHPYWDFPPLLCREVVWACRPALLAIASALDDQRQPISSTALRQLKTFLTEAGTSPLFGDNPAAARHAAQELQRSFTGHPERGRAS